MAQKIESDIENLDTPIGKEILGCLLLKNGPELAALLEQHSLHDFIDQRCHRYHETLTEGYQSESFTSGAIGDDGIVEMARAEAFDGLS